jgi:hypothetical protein
VVPRILCNERNNGPPQQINRSSEGQINSRKGSRRPCDASCMHIL